MLVATLLQSLTGNRKKGVRVEHTLHTLTFFAEFLTAKAST